LKDRVKWHTFELNVSMDEVNFVQKAYRFAKFAPNPAQVGFVYEGVLFVRVDQVKELLTVDVFQHKTMMR
jgi:hypothetical protein